MLKQGPAPATRSYQVQPGAAATPTRAAPSKSPAVLPRRIQPTFHPIQKVNVLPDLFISRLSTSSKRVRSGSKVKLSAWVKNSGKHTVRGVKIIMINTQNRKKLGESVVTIGPGKTVQVAITGLLTGRGKVTIEVQVDPQRHIAEVNEQNNRAKMVLTVSQPVVAGRGQMLHEKTLPGRGAGAATPAAKAAHPGRRRTPQAAAALRTVPNAASGTSVHIAAGPELAAGRVRIKLRLDRNTVVVGQPLVARAVIENRARSRIENLPVVFFLNGKKIGAKKIMIGANSARTTTFRYVPRQTGKHVLSVRAGPAGRIGQRRERSNTAKARLTVNETRFTQSPATGQALMSGHAEPIPGKAAARNKVAVPTVKDGHRIAPVTGEGKRGRSGAQVGALQGTAGHAALPKKRQFIGHDLSVTLEDALSPEQIEAIARAQPHGLPVVEPLPVTEPHVADLSPVSFEKVRSGPHRGRLALVVKAFTFSGRPPREPFPVQLKNEGTGEIVWEGMGRVRNMLFGWGDLVVTDYQPTDPVMITAIINPHLRAGTPGPVYPESYRDNNRITKAFNWEHSGHRNTARRIQAVRTQDAIATQAYSLERIAQGEDWSIIQAGYNVGYENCRIVVHVRSPETRRYERRISCTPGGVTPVHVHPGASQTMDIFCHVRREGITAQEFVATEEARIICGPSPQGGSIWGFPSIDSPKNWHLSNNWWNEPLGPDATTLPDYFIPYAYIRYHDGVPSVLIVNVSNIRDGGTRNGLPVDLELHDPAGHLVSTRHYHFTVVGFPGNPEAGTHSISLREAQGWHWISGHGTAGGPWIKIKVGAGRIESSKINNTRRIDVVGAGI